MFVFRPAKLQHKRGFVYRLSFCVAFANVFWKMLFEFHSRIPNVAERADKQSWNESFEVFWSELKWICENCATFFWWKVMSSEKKFFEFSIFCETKKIRFWSENFRDWKINQLFNKPLLELRKNYTNEWNTERSLCLKWNKWWGEYEDLCRIKTSRLSHKISFY